MGGTYLILCLFFVTLLFPFNFLLGVFNCYDHGYIKSISYQLRIRLCYMSFLSIFLSRTSISLPFIYLFRFNLVASYIMHLSVTLWSSYSSVITPVIAGGSGISDTHLHLGGEWQMWINVLPKNLSARLKFEPSIFELRVRVNEPLYHYALS